MIAGASFAVAPRLAAGTLVGTDTARPRAALFVRAFGTRDVDGRSGGGPRGRWTLGPRTVRQLRKPLLVLQGRHDHMQPLDQSRQIYQAAHHPKQIELLGTGHMPRAEAPDALAGLITRWLATTTRPAP